MNKILWMKLILKLSIEILFYFIIIPQNRNEIQERLRNQNNLWKLIQWVIGHVFWLARFLDVTT